MGNSCLERRYWAATSEGTIPRGDTQTPTQPCKPERMLTCHGTGPKWSPPNQEEFVLLHPLTLWYA